MRLPWFRRRGMCPFYLERSEDVSGVSGTGVVAIGVLMPSGRAILEWRSRTRTLTVFDSVDDIVRIHGHGGRTRLAWGLPPGEGGAGPRALPPPTVVEVGDALEEARELLSALSGGRRSRRPGIRRFAEGDAVEDVDLTGPDPGSRPWPG